MKPETPSIDTPFIALLTKTITDKDRGQRAELRRYWSPGTRHYAYPVLGRLGVLAEAKLPDAITAALYAEYPHHQLKGSSIGKAWRRLAGDNTASYESHFRRLLSCDGGDLEDVGQQLHLLIRRIERENIPLNFNQLLWDLRKWRNSSDNVKIGWARDFWHAPSEEELSTPNPIAS